MFSSAIDLSDNFVLILECDGGGGGSDVGVDKWEAVRDFLFSAGALPVTLFDANFRILTEQRPFPVKGKIFSSARSTSCEVTSKTFR